MVKNTILHSGELAKVAGVSPDTIRHYERVGVLPRASRSNSGYRIYPAETVERVLGVRRALRFGFTLAELAEVLRARDAGGAPCRRVYELAQKKLKGISADIAALQQTQRDLRQVMADWQHRIRQTAPGERANLLQSLTGSTNSSGMKTNRFRKAKS